MFHLLKRNLRRFILKPRTDLYAFIFGGRESQTDDPENAKLVLYRSTRVRGNTYLERQNEREKDRQTETERQTDRQRETEREREMY